jgi:hypothetical protein
MLLKTLPCKAITLGLLNPALRHFPTFVFHSYNLQTKMESHMNPEDGENVSGSGQ